ncbi:MAG: beta-ketoacyl synthase N-terminal-like domain-containing protein, partial [Alphaproteobacteria bacterium]|nr:beta-ketoacyl synthase N-terminal-like domain-containing protein [Alphaproteobacteria bacterium]
MNPDSHGDMSRQAAGEVETQETGLSAEPIAVVGMACRFPGADNLDDFWRLLESGGNTVIH